MRQTGFAALALLAAAFVLSACGGIGFDTTGWFSRPLDLFGSRSGYTYSNLDATRQQHPITANDLVDANGACPKAAANAVEDSSGAPDAAAMLGGGPAIGMSECGVVARLGSPSSVNLGRTPNGDRSAVLTFRSGSRPGVYRFAAGRLTEMDRIEEPAPLAAEPAKKKVAKKKAVKLPQMSTAEHKT